MRAIRQFRPSAESLDMRLLMASGDLMPNPMDPLPVPVDTPPPCINPMDPLPVPTNDAPLDLQLLTPTNPKINDNTPLELC